MNVLIYLLTLLNLYVTERQAYKRGYTHHGWYFGLPVWIRNPELLAPDLITKSPWCEPLFTLFTYIEGFLRMLADDDPVFQIKVGHRIKALS